MQKSAWISCIYWLNIFIFTLHDIILVTYTDIYEEADER